jgi:SEC-C motif domain protein
MKKRAGEKSDCPCESGREYSDCCKPVLKGEVLPATAEALMRSRYTAYVREDADYLRRTWDPDNCPPDLTFNPGQRWLGLKIINCDGGGANDESGTVEFVARFKLVDRGHRLHELSRFQRIDGLWRYMDGELVPARNTEERP